MSQELLYTSATRGLKPGSSGFCTVASTRGMAGPLASALESLSAYRHVFRPGDPQADRNPVAWVHVKLNAGGRPYCVLSRVADYGQDYSGRTNKLAHHVALQANETPTSGPARMLEQRNFMETSWDGEPRILPVGRAVEDKHRATLGACRHWQDMTGDAGWAGVLAESFLDDPQRPVYIIFEPGMEILPLFGEAIELLPENRRWDVTFSTYFTSLPRGVTCNWRCLLAGSKEANESRRFVHALRIDLTQPLERVEGGTLVEQARTGKQIRRPLPASASPASEPEYFEVVGAENGGGGLPESGRESSSYSIPGTPTVPPPPPRRRQWTDTTGTDSPRRALKLAVTVAVLVVMVGTIAGGVYVLQTRKPNKPDATVAQGKPKKETKDEAKAVTTTAIPKGNPPTGRTVAMSGDTTPQQATAAANQTKNSSTAGESEDTTPVKANGNETKGQPDKTGKPDKNTKDGGNGDSGSGKPAVAAKTEPAKSKKQYEYVPLPGSPDDGYEKESIKRFIVKSVTLSTDSPRLSLLIPSFVADWESKSNGTTVELRHKSNDVKLATFAIEKPELSDGSNTFQLLLDIPRNQFKKPAWQNLKWCVLQLDDGPMKHRYILQKPHTSRLKRRLVDWKLTWEFPLAQRTKGSKIAGLKIAYICLKVDGKTLSFTPTSTNDLTAKGLQDFFDDNFVGMLDENQQDKLQRKPLKMWHTIDDDRRFSVTLSKFSARKTSNTVDDYFTFHVKRECEANKIPYDVKRRDIEAFVAASGWVTKRLDESANGIRLEKAKKNKNEDRIKRKQTTYDVLNTLQTIAKTLQRRRKALATAELTAAYIYYEVTTREKESLKVDVIKFGEAPKAIDKDESEPEDKLNP